MNGMLHLQILVWILHQATAQFGSSEQAAGYVDIRSGCHMFYWLFYAAEMGQQYTKRPLIIWLQGGPGTSATGDANFKLIGPMSLDLKDRETTWTKKFNVLFIDNPVGTGFSYVDNESLYVSSNEEVAEDLIKFLAGFYIKHSEFITVPLYICGQSYGGKVAAEFALRLVQSMSKGIKPSVLKGVALGNAWLSPPDSVLGWAPLLEAIGTVDTAGASSIRKAASRIKHLVDIENYFAAMLKASELQDLILNQASSFNFCDITLKTKDVSKAKESSSLSKSALEFARVFGATKKETPENDLDYIMNTLVKPELDIPEGVVWGAQSAAVVQSLAYDFMKPVTERIGELLNTTDIKVIIYNGNHDALCDTLGQQSWIGRLKWKESSIYKVAPRNPIWIDDRLEGYIKEYRNFKFYWVNGAGHSVPVENPAMMEIIMEDLTGF